MSTFNGFDIYLLCGYVVDMKCSYSKLLCSRYSQRSSRSAGPLLEKHSQTRLYRKSPQFSEREVFLQIFALKVSDLRSFINTVHQHW